MSPASVQAVLDDLAELERDLVTGAAALRIQRHFRGWQCRRRVAWDPNTTTGRGLILMSFRRMPPLTGVRD